MRDEETPRETYLRLLKARPKGMTGRGRKAPLPVINAQKPRKHYKHDPTHHAAGQQGKVVICLDTGEIYPSLRAASTALGESVNMFYNAFQVARGDPRIAKFAGKRWAYEQELPQ